MGCQSEHCSDMFQSLTLTPLPSLPSTSREDNILLKHLKCTQITKSLLLALGRTQTVVGVFPGFPQDSFESSPRAQIQYQRTKIILKHMHSSGMNPVFCSLLHTIKCKTEEFSKIYICSIDKCFSQSLSGDFQIGSKK